LLHQLPRGDLSLGHCRLDLRDRGFDDGEAGGALGGERGDRQDQRANESSSWHAPYLKIDRRIVEITFEHACDIVGAALRGSVRREIVAGLMGKTLGPSLLALRDAMRANRFRASGQQIFLDRVVTAYDGRTRAEGFHILHDWDGVSQQVNPDIIPVDVLHFLADQRGGEAATEVELQRPGIAHDAGVGFRRP
jgi:hypothetical protein